MYGPWLDEGFARPGARRTRDDFEIAATCHVQIVADAADEKQAVIDGMKPVVALYMGGMGAPDQNFHKQVFDRMGRATSRSAARCRSCSWPGFGRPPPP